MAMRQRQNQLRAIGLLTLLALPAIALNGAELDAFDALDAQLEAQFSDTDATLEENFQALDAALEAGFQRMAQEVEAVWGTSEVVLPDQNTWVDYSKNKRLRRSFDFERGVLVVETLVNAAGDMTQASADIQQAVLKAQSDTAQDLADNDLGLAYAEAYLAAEGITLETADNLDPAPILGELLQISEREFAKLSTAIETAELTSVAESAVTALSTLPGQDKTSPMTADTNPAQPNGQNLAAEQPNKPSGLSDDNASEPAKVAVAIGPPPQSAELSAPGATNQDSGEGVTDAIADDGSLDQPIDLDVASAPVASAVGIVTQLTKIPGNQRKLTVTIPLRADYLSERAKRYDQAVLDEADRRGLPPSLIFAIMETESHFNPRARSHVPAFGLMQLVPKSGGVDAYNYVYGEKKILAPEYFFQPNQNVELGTAYLDLLFRRYLRRITDEQSRLYCTIAAYNTGAGNVAKAFTGKTNVAGAADLINALSAEEVYEYLIQNLPYDETRNYLKKVRAAQEKYKDLDVTRRS